MPIFKGTAHKAKPNKVIKYITNPDKAVIVTSIGLNDSQPYAQQLRDTYLLHKKGLGEKERKYYHFKLSPNVTDQPTAEATHKLAEQLAQRLFPDHECVIATHNDKDHLHSHIVVSAVNYETGRKLQINDRDYRQAKDLANELGQPLGFTPLDWRQATKDKRQREQEGYVHDPVGHSQAEKYLQAQYGADWIDHSWKESLRQAISTELTLATDRQHLAQLLLDNYGIEMPRNTVKTVTFKHPALGDSIKPIRGNKLGEHYTVHYIDQRLQANLERSATHEQIRTNPTDTLTSRATASQRSAINAGFDLVRGIIEGRRTEESRQRELTAKHERDKKHREQLDKEQSAPARPDGKESREPREQQPAVQPKPKQKSYDRGR